MSIEELNLVTSEAVPDDANCLMINGPQKDITADEKDRILDYMEKGGHVLIFTDYTETDMPNMAELLNNYGLSTSAGLILKQQPVLLSGLSILSDSEDSECRCGGQHDIQGSGADAVCTEYQYF